ncbi:MAG TPA: MMPL family transporter [Chthoniobacterales bacterium]|jgi:predicted exporter|nr:MMPL family transporter [Chthoniobacterales bacterium]
MAIHSTIAHLVTRRRGLVWMAVALISGVSIALLITRMKLDTEVLNLLPSGFESVEGLKVYNRDFAQVRDLTFALVSRPEDVDKLEEFAPIFAQRLREQPWCRRVLSGVPLESPEGVRDLQSIAVPLLLNLEPAAFAETISMLEPAKLQQRLHRLREEIEAGSPRPQIELGLDPLGMIGPALKPFAGNASIQEDQPLTSPDRTMRVFLTVTNQPGIGAFDCQKLMREVQAFQKAAQEGWEGGPLQVLVTGRSAYVAEISLSMRTDIVETVLISIALVGGVFFLGFRRLLPLLGMGISLLLCCVVALAGGLLIFRELNLVTVGFCAILIGLGVDFAILVFGRYQQARDDGEDHPAAVSEAVRGLGQAIFFGALTTAVGFLALTLAGSRGFTQLGVLIALGIGLAAIFMMTVFFLFLPRKSPAPGHDWMFTLVKRYVRWAVLHPARMLWISVPVLLLLTAIACSPKPPIIFDVSTHSMEPKKSDAGYALKTIMEKMPTRWEPAIGMIKADNPQQLHDYWQKVEPRWAALQVAGKIKGYSTPAALALSPERLETNRRKLSSLDFASTKQALENAVAAEGFSPETFASGFNLLGQLEGASNLSTPLPDWREMLPQTSGWWFLIDRYFAHDPLLTTGFVTTNEPVATQEQKEMLHRELRVPGVPMTLSGWSFTLTDLVPWSQRQLILISSLMALFDAALLAFLYRDWRLWLIQIATLALAVCAMIASMKLLQIPLNLLNVLAFRLVLAIGVDYGIYVLLVWKKARQLDHDVAGVVKPVILAGLTAICGFGSLGVANNPTLAGLGYACALGLFWSLAATIFFTLPAAAAAEPKSWREESLQPRVQEPENA